MLSLESEVIERHLSALSGKSVLLFGDVRDDFAATLRQTAREVAVFSSYFDYTHQHVGAEFGLTCNAQAEVAIYYWTKNKQECQFQLLQWLSQAQVGQALWIIGENRAGVRSVEKMLEPYGAISKIDSARRCGLYQFELQSVPEFNYKKYWKSYRLQGLSSKALDVFALPAVFSSAELDQGSKLLLSTFDKADGLKGKILDLGCGAGVIGAFLKLQFPKVKLLMSDIHAMALESSRRTLTENALEGEVVASDVFSHIEARFELIISNPPFHDGVDTAYRAVETLIAQAKAHLAKGGELRIVANAFLPYPDLLDQAFGSHQVLAKTGKFKVYSARNR